MLEGRDPQALKVAAASVSDGGGHVVGTALHEVQPNRLPRLGSEEA